MVVVALVGRELYESSKTDKPECPSCPFEFQKFERPILHAKTKSTNDTGRTNGRCWENEESVGKMFGFEYTVYRLDGTSCCSVPMLRFQDPVVIWVWCSNIFISTF